MIYSASRIIDDVVPVHVEVLLPAFVLGCMLARPAGADPHADDAREGHQDGPEDAARAARGDHRVGAFMVFVGLSMPAIEPGAGMGWGTLAWRTLVVTLLANRGKMFPRSATAPKPRGASGSRRHLEGDGR